MPVLKCTICQVPKFSLEKLLLHIYIIHSQADSFLVTCNVNGCPSQFSKFESFRKHVRRKHGSLFHNGLNLPHSNCQRPSASSHLSEVGNDVRLSLDTVCASRPADD